MEVDVAIDLSFLGDIGSTLGNMVTKYPEFKALDQANLDRAEFKDETFQAAQDILTRVREGDLDKYAQYLGVDPSEARNELLNVDNLQPKPSESSEDYFKRASERISALSKAGVGLSTLGHASAKGLLNDEAKLDMDSIRNKELWSGAQDELKGKSKAEADQYFGSNQMDTRNPIAQGIYGQIDKDAITGMQDKLHTNALKLRINKNSKYSDIVNGLKKGIDLTTDGAKESFSAYKDALFRDLETDKMLVKAEREGKSTLTRNQAKGVEARISSATKEIDRLVGIAKNGDHMETLGMTPGSIQGDVARLNTIVKMSKKALDKYWQTGDISLDDSDEADIAGEEAGLKAEGEGATVSKSLWPEGESKVHVLSSNERMAKVQAENMGEGAEARGNEVWKNGVMVKKYGDESLAPESTGVEEVDMDEFF